MKTIHRPRGTLRALVVLCVLPHPARALQPAAVIASGLYVQESGVGAPLGKLNVPSKMMAGNCITMVSPNYPQGGDSPKRSRVIVRVVIWKSGSVTPMRVISGDPSLEIEAMNTVRLWHYKPFVRDKEPLDVATDLTVDFDPTKPGGLVTHPNR